MIPEMLKKTNDFINKYSDKQLWQIDNAFIKFIEEMTDYIGEYIDEDKINEIVSQLEKIANQLEKDAIGEKNDGGAGKLREKISIWQAGLAGKVPDQWKEHLKEADPEYAEYERLKKKFENR